MLNLPHTSPRSHETVEHVERFTTDAGGFADTQPEHDAAGNLTYDGIYAYSYDAWNHLVKVTKAYKDDQGTLHLGSVVMEADYDGLGRRGVKYVVNSADLDSTYHFYHHQQSVIETRNGSDLVVKQHVWGLQYIDELVQTSINEDPADLTEQECERVYYALHNANYNVEGKRGRESLTMQASQTLTPVPFSPPDMLPR